MQDLNTGVIILTCQLAIAWHMETIELNAPDGFALTCMFMNPEAEIL